MLTRPALAPHARLLYREPGAVQLGVCPQTGIVLTGLTEPELTLLTLLDGSRDLGSLRRWARRMRADPVRVSELLEHLETRGLLREGPALPRLEARTRSQTHLAPYDESQAEVQAIRLRHRLQSAGPELVRARTGRAILVDGHGNLADVVAATLRSGGYGRVSAGAWAAAAGDLRRRAASDADHHDPDEPDLVVMVAADVLNDDEVAPWRGTGTAHLPVVTNGSTVEVGPMLGRNGPCARCLHLHRADRDPAWPELLAQLTTPRAGDPPLAMVSSAVAAIAAGAAATMAADYLDLQLIQPGLAFEVQPQAPYLLRRRWLPHPRCACPAETVTMSA